MGTWSIFKKKEKSRRIWKPCERTPCVRERALLSVCCQFCILDFKVIALSLKGTGREIFLLAENSASTSDSVHLVLIGSEATEAEAEAESEEKETLPDPSDFDSVELPTPPPILLFD